MRAKPETVANVSIKEYCFSKKQIKGIVEASQFKWTFTWSFNKGLLTVNPPLGRALIEDALLRFLLKKDYELEAGNEYKFTTISYVLGNISQEEKSILDKVYKRVIKSLEQLNTKKEEYIINELNSFDKDQY